VNRYLFAAGTTMTFVALVQGCAGPRANPERDDGAGAATLVAADSAGACVNPGAAHKVYVVVQYIGGAVVEKCVGFDAPQLSGDDLMKLSGLTYQTQEFSAGLAVCSIGGEPGQVAACLPRGVAWWFLYVSTWWRVGVFR